MYVHTSRPHTRNRCPSALLSHYCTATTQLRTHHTLGRTLCDTRRHRPRVPVCMTRTRLPHTQHQTHEKLSRTLHIRNLSNQDRVTARTWHARTPLLERHNPHRDGVGCVVEPLLVATFCATWVSSPQPHFLFTKYSCFFAQTESGAGWILDSLAISKLRFWNGSTVSIHKTKIARECERFLSP